MGDSIGIIDAMLRLLIMLPVETVENDRIGHEELERRVLPTLRGLFHENEDFYTDFDREGSADCLHDALTSEDWISALVACEELQKQYNEFC